MDECKHLGKSHPSDDFTYDVCNDCGTMFSRISREERNELRFARLDEKTKALVRAHKTKAAMPTLGAFRYFQHPGEGVQLVSGVVNGQEIRKPEFIVFTKDGTRNYSLEDMQEIVQKMHDIRNDAFASKRAREALAAAAVKASESLTGEEFDEAMADLDAAIDRYKKVKT